VRNAAFCATLLWQCGQPRVRRRMPGCSRPLYSVQRADSPRKRMCAAANWPQLALPVVATHPVQFLSADDYKAHEARVCIAEGYVLNDKRRARAFTPQQYFKTQAEMAALFADLPEALANTVEISKRCNLTLQLGKPYLPNFPTPDGMSLDDFLRAESELGLQQRMAVLYPDEQLRAAKMPEYAERLAFEVNTIINMKFPGYFLMWPTSYAG
jgi:DNA polymerase-3 subunit alpha